MSRFSTHLLPTNYHLLTTLNALTLLLAAVGLRCCLLGNIPGCNGDEAWYGVQAWRAMHGEPFCWQTPTGNPLNGLFLGPLALLHIWFAPSIALLRSVAVASGLAALAVNWLLCRWVFDRRTAAISTVVLAILPIDIAYSRFAWDACQSLAATLPVVYLAIASVRFPSRFGRWIAAAVVAQLVAVWVHPTNVFACAAIVAAVAAQWALPTTGETQPSNDAFRRRSFAAGRWWVAAAALVTIGAGLWAMNLSRTPLPGRIAQRFGDLRELVQPHDLPHFSVLYARLFTGGTIYRYIAGSRSWFEWPLPENLDGWGLDVGLFWLCILGSAWLLWHCTPHAPREAVQCTPHAPREVVQCTPHAPREVVPPNLTRSVRSTILCARADRVLLATWALGLVTFLLIAGPRAMAPGEERFTICLIGPAVLLASRGAALGCEAAAPRWRMALAAGALLGWFVLADFHEHYFRFIQRTGGEAHLTFRTAEVEPKEAALQYILDRRSAGPTAICCSQWWNLWPIRYLALPEREIIVVEDLAAKTPIDQTAVPKQGQTWHVEFYGTEAQQRLEARFAGRGPQQTTLADYAGRPILCVLQADAK